MKKLFLLILIFISAPLMAKEIEYLKTLYAKKEYQRTYNRAQVFLKQNPMNKDVQLLFANSAYHLGRSDEAMAAYDRVLMIAPNNTTSKIQLAKLYIKAKAYRLAGLELDTVSKQRLSKKQKQEVLTLKKKLRPHRTQKAKNKQKPTQEKSKQAHAADKPFMNIGLNIGLLYDSNVNSDIGEGVYKIPVNNFPYAGSKAKGKFAHFESIGLSKDIGLTDSSGLLTYLSLYNKNYINHDAKTDLAYGAFGLSPHYTMSNFRVSLPMGFNRIFLDYKGYVNNYNLGLDVKRALSNGLIEAGYQYSQSRFDGKNTARNANNHGLYLGFRHNLFSDVSQSIRVNYAKNKEVKDLRTDINYNSYALGTDFHIKATKSLTAKVGLSFANYAYEDLNKVFLNKRADKVYALNLGLGYAISKHSHLSLDVNYINKKSNQFAYEYSKLLIPFVYSYRF